jgi:hypothetical protein
MQTLKEKRIEALRAAGFMVEPIPSSEYSYVHLTAHTKAVLDLTSQESSLSDLETQINMFNARCRKLKEILSIPTITDEEYERVRKFLCAISSLGIDPYISKELKDSIAEHAHILWEDK